VTAGGTLVARPLTAAGFAGFGEVIETGGPFRPINDGFCRRFDDLARVDVVDGRAGLSLFDAEIRPLPYRFDLLERHPLGSQCFLPMAGARWLVIAAPDAGGTPGAPVAFMAGPGQGVNIARNVWHGVLAPVAGGGLFAVIDRIGPGPNLQERRLPAPMTVVAAPSDG
jgi:ureidoglycolate lyase